ncbi:MFS transporter [Spirillospora sp. CA-294931]|uniref:MFS transporter n=1 Tax=Spirillospora sp. CA-294931 TaxID=3240042 RepID=UPI003D900A29
MASPPSEQVDDPRPGLLHDTEFLKLWVGQSLSQIGAQVTFLAVPLAAVLVLHASAAEMGVLSALVRLPMVGFLLFGVLVDRVRKRPVLIWTDIGRAAVLLLIPLLYFADMLTMAVIYVVVFVLGVLSVLFQVAYRTYIPHLVAREHLADGNSKLQMSESVAQALGPGLVGGLIKVVSAPVLILIDVVTYLVSAVACWLIRTPEAKPAPDDDVRSVYKAVWEGYQWVMRQPLVRPLAIGTAFYSFFIMGAMQSIFVLYLLKGGPDLDAAWVGVITATGGAGAILGAGLAIRATKRLGIGPTLLWSTVIGNCALFLVPLAVRPVWLAVAMLAVSQFVVWACNQIFIVNNLTLIQSVTPMPMIGRILATIFSLGLIPAPLGALGAGLLGEWLGLRAAIFIAIVFGALVPILALARSPIPKLKEIPEPVS